MENLPKVLAEDKTLLKIENGGSTIAVYQLKKVAEYSINGQHLPLSVKVDNGNYVINRVDPTKTQNWHLERARACSALNLNFNNGSFIGSADFEDVKIAQVSYDLEQCPVLLKKTTTPDHILEIYSPCADVCSSPNTGCRKVWNKEKNT